MSGSQTIQLPGRNRKLEGKPAVVLGEKILADIVRVEDFNKFRK